MLYSGQDAMVIVLIAGVQKTLSEDCNSLAQCPLSGVSKLDHPDQGRMFSATSLWTWLFAKTNRELARADCLILFARILFQIEGHVFVQLR
jgi:hypothetical protein